MSSDVAEYTLRDKIQSKTTDLGNLVKVVYILRAVMVQRLEALATLLEDLGSVPTTHMTAHSYLQHQFQWMQ